MDSDLLLSELDRHLSYVPYEDELFRLLLYYVPLLPLLL
jgi:hypothetical protein